MQQISSQLRDPITAINENFAAAKAAALFGIDLSRSVGLLVYFYGGRIFIDGTGDGFDIIPDQSLTLPASEPDVFVEADASGEVSLNTVGFTPGDVPLYKLATNANGIISVDDYRVMIPQFSAGGSGGASELTQLTDVEIDTGLADGDALAWDSGLSKWINKAPSGGGSGLVEIVPSTPITAIPAISITDIPQIYSALLLRISGAQFNTTSRRLKMGISFNNGATYTHTGFAGHFIQETTVVNALDVAGYDAIGPGLQASSSAADLNILITGYTAGALTQFISAGLYDSAKSYSGSVVFYSGSNAVNAIELLADAAANFIASGSYALYGIK